MSRDFCEIGVKFGMPCRNIPGRAHCYSYEISLAYHVLSAIESAATLTACFRWSRMRKTQMLVKNVTFPCQSAYFRTFT